MPLPLLDHAGAEAGEDDRDIDEKAEDELPASVLARVAAMLARSPRKIVLGKTEAVSELMKTSRRNLKRQLHALAEGAYVNREDVFKKCLSTSA